MDVSVTIKFSVIISDNNILRLTAEVVSSQNISKNIFLMTNDDVCKGICSPRDLTIYPDEKTIGGMFYRSNIVAYNLSSSAEVIKIKNDIKRFVSELVNEWRDIGDVIGQEIWTATSS